MKRNQHFRDKATVVCTPYAPKPVPSLNEQSAISPVAESCVKSPLTVFIYIFNCTSEIKFYMNAKLCKSVALNVLVEFFE